MSQEMGRFFYRKRKEKKNKKEKEKEKVLTPPQQNASVRFSPRSERDGDHKIAKRQEASLIQKETSFSRKSSLLHP